MKKILTVILTLALIVGVSVLPAKAEKAESLPIGGLAEVTAIKLPDYDGHVTNRVSLMNSTKAKLFGDADRSGDITAADALYLAKYLAGISSFTADTTFCDVNYDGTVDMLDLAILQRHIAGWSDYASLPFGKELYGSTNDYMPDVLYYESLPELSGLEYAKLNDAQKAVYRDIEAAIESFSTEYIFTYFSSLEELCLVYYSVKRDHPEYFWLANSYGYGKVNTTGNYFLQINYIYDSEAAKDAHAAELRTVLKGLVDYIGDTDYSDYGLELMIHDWICNRNEYDHTAASTGMSTQNFNSWTLYGALVSGKSVCEGYAEAFQFCLAMFGINSTVVTGDVHMWNYVMLDNDAYYVDPTWNDDDSNNTVYHTYFNLTYAQISESRNFYSDYSSATSASIHSGSFNYNIPQSTATKYNYFVVNGTYLTSVDSAAMLAAIKEAAGTAYSSGKTSATIEFRFSSKSVCSNTADLNIVNLISSINSSSGLPYYINSYSYTTNTPLPYYRLTVSLASR